MSELKMEKKIWATPNLTIDHIRVTAGSELQFNYPENMAQFWCLPTNSQKLPAHTARYLEILNNFPHLNLNLNYIFFSDIPISPFKSFCK